MDEAVVTLGAIKRWLALALAIGVVSGALGGALFGRYGANQIPTDRRQVLIQESSATIAVIKQVSPSVVSITSQASIRSLFGGVQTQAGAGTGIIVTTDGLIMTNKHVVAAAGASYQVFTSDGKQYAASVVARDSINDLAFVRIKANGLKPAKLGDSSQLVVGQSVIAIGNALGQFQNTATTGIISGLGRPIVAGDGGGSAESLQDLIQTDAAINPGNSGGPLVNLEGEVIGINTAVSGSGQNISFAIPVNEVKAQVSSVQSQGKIVRPYLGVAYVPITKDLATQNSLPTSAGAYLASSGDTSAIQPGSPAEKAGLKEGDIITKLDGDSITGSNSLTSLIGQHKVGDTIELTIIRDRKTMTVKATLAAAPE